MTPTLLHIGCGDSRIDEFVNIDCVPTETTDLVAAAWDLAANADATVEYIYTRHMFEHLSRSDAQRALSEWRRVLKVGGIVHIVVPDIAFHARQLLGLQVSQSDDQEEHALAGFYGWQRNGAETDCHRWGYTPASLARLLTANGFQMTEDGIACLTERDLEPWHVNMRATKE